MKRLLFFLTAFIFSAAAYSQAEIDRLIDEGIKLHDEGKYEEALKKYDSCLSLNKNHYLVNYEKSYTLLSVKRYDECISISKFLLELEPQNINTKGVYVNLGSAQDDKGDVEEAIRTFTKAIGQFPDFHLLHFNRGITYYKVEKDNESMIDFQNALKCNPLHPGSHQFLGRLVMDNNRIPGIMSYFTFLMIEPEGQRAAENYRMMDKLIMKGVTESQDGKGTTVIGIEALMPDKKNKKTENDFSSLDVFLSLSSALDSDDKYKNQNAAEKLNRKMGDMISMVKERKQNGTGFYWDFYVPFLTELKDKKQLETACYIASLYSESEAVEKWLNENQGKTEDFYKWLNEYKWSVKK